MKKFSVLTLLAVLCLIISTALVLSCKKGEKPAPDALDKDTSYSFGMLIASQMGLGDLHFDYNAFMEGFRDFNEARETRLTPEKAMEKINAVFTQLQAKNNEQAWQEGLKNQEAGEAFLAENGARSDVTTQPSGLQYEVLSSGSGKKPVPGNVVRVHYEGTLIDGTVFDSSYQRGDPAEFSLMDVIPGWIEGLQLMNEGSKYRFVIPANLAYGQNGSGPIPPNSTLIFLVELISVVN